MASFSFTKESQGKTNGVQISILHRFSKCRLFHNIDFLTYGNLGWGNFGCGDACNLSSCGSISLISHSANDHESRDGDYDAYAIPDFGPNNGCGSGTSINTNFACHRSQSRIYCIGSR